jgi:hypothetical protein
MLVRNSSPAITNCTLAGNEAGADWHPSGLGGGIAITQGASPVLANCKIVGNRNRHYGAGVYAENSFSTIVNCTIADNSGWYGGAGLCSTASAPTVMNCILWGDSYSEIFISPGGWYPDRQPIVSHCDIQGGYPGTGNLNADPRFESGYHLPAGSPCIDSGSNLDAPAADLDGIVRPQDGNGDGLAIVDMGAYEVAGPSALSSRFLLDRSDPEYIPDRAFRTPKNRTALANKIEVALLMIDGGHFAEALNMLENDVLRKVDGWAVKGAPDKDDWVVDCTYQQVLYQRVNRAMSALRMFLGKQ